MKVSSGPPALRAQRTPSMVPATTASTIAVSESISVGPTFSLMTSITGFSLT